MRIDARCKSNSGALAQLCQLYPTYKPNQTFPPQETAALLLNAVYFKGGWASPFKRELTSTRQFLLADVSNNNNKSSATYVETEFMFREGQVELGRQPGPSALLPFLLSHLFFSSALCFSFSPSPSFRILFPSNSALSFFPSFRRLPSPSF